VREGNYLDGYIRCACGETSPLTTDPMAPFRWIAKHVCGGRDK
jgi:hypothetical protein